MKFTRLIILSIMIFSCNQSGDKPNENKLPEADNKIADMLVQEMTAKYDVEENWFNDSLMFFYDTYTLELQEMVLGDSSRTILFYASVKDIKKTSTGYRAILSNNYRLPIFDLYYDLIMSKEQVDYLLAQHKSPFDEYAIVAHISQVDRVNSRISIEEGYGDEPSYASLDIPGNFIIKGNCLDILYIGETVWSID